MILIPQSNVITDRVLSITDKSDSALNTRFTIWPERIKAMFEKPWGYGIGVTGGARPLPFGWCDSQFISVGIETGFIGLFIFLWIILLILIKEKKLLNSSKDQFSKMIACWITAFTIAFLWNMLTNQTLLMYPLPLYFWFMIGILYRIKHIEGTVINNAR